jgi:hypothetical protein
MQHDIKFLLDQDDPLDFAEVRELVRAEIGTVSLPTQSSNVEELKAAIRHSHQHQKTSRGTRELGSIGSKIPSLMKHFASGPEVVPDKISPLLELVDSDTESGDVFRLATLLWSVPVSKGFGRRMRYLVRDQHNGKIIGIFAIGDPVFNLRTRDQWIGWNVEQRTLRLAHVMDAYIVGAVPPYSNLLGGKLVTSLMGSDEVRLNFRNKYEGRTGIISELSKPAHLGLVTVTSSLGKSSLYNRLKLGNMIQLKQIGFTEGWGHFQISDIVFEVLRRVLVERGHAYANGHKYGHGPNWKIRTIREGLTALELDPDVLRHGIRREVFAMPICNDVKAFLKGEEEYSPSTFPMATIADAAIERWVLPRAHREPKFGEWKREETERLIRSAAALQMQLPI